MWCCSVFGSSATEVVLFGISNSCALSTARAGPKHRWAQAAQFNGSRFEAGHRFSSRGQDSKATHQEGRKYQSDSGQCTNGRKGARISTFLPEQLLGLWLHSSSAAALRCVIKGSTRTNETSNSGLYQLRERCTGKKRRRKQRTNVQCPLDSEGMRYNNRRNRSASAFDEELLNIRYPGPSAAPTIRLRRMRSSSV